MSDTEKMVAACELVAKIMNVEPAGLMTAVNESDVIRAQVNRAVYNFGYRWDESRKRYRQQLPPPLERLAKGLINDEDRDS